jgi:hypothetical protein
MSVKACLDHWRSERLRLLAEIAYNFNDATGYRQKLEASLLQVESFIAYYEERARDQRNSCD